MRAKSQPNTRANVRTSNVLATPGTPSIRAWLPVKMAMSAFSITSCWPMITLPVSCRAWARTSFNLSVFMGRGARVEGRVNCRLISRAVFQNRANPLVGSDGIPLPLRSGVLGLEQGLDQLQFGGYARAAVGERFFPFAQADRQHVAREHVAAQQIDEAGSGLLARDILLPPLVCDWRRQAQGVFPDKQAGQKNQARYQSVQAVLPKQGRHAGIFFEAEMRFVKDDLAA